MGWSSGGQIFDLVAQGMIDASADEAIVDRVLTELAVALTDRDWDTLDSSIDVFAGHPVVQHALRKAQGWLYLYAADDRGQGHLEYSPDSAGGLWRMTLDEVELTAEGTVAGFNQLVDAWAAHGGEDEYGTAAAEYRLT